MDITRQEGQGVPFFACAHPAWAGAAHGFSTRHGGISPAPMDSLNLAASRGDDPANVAENFRRFCRAVGADPGALVKNHQVHSSIVRTVTGRTSSPPRRPPASLRGTAWSPTCPGCA